MSSKENKIINVRYYALLREQRGCSEETIETEAKTAESLYEELQCKYAFTLDSDRLQVALNDSFALWTDELKTGDNIVFIPPVAGG